MQLKVGLKATSHVREKFLGKVFATYDLFAIKPSLVTSLPILDFHIRENTMNFQGWSWIFKNLPEFHDISEFNDRNFRKIWKTRVSPASPLPYLVYEGMSHTFDILQSLSSQSSVSSRSFISVGFFLLKFSEFLEISISRVFLIFEKNCTFLNSEFQ